MVEFRFLQMCIFLEDGNSLPFFAMYKKIILANIRKKIK